MTWLPSRLNGERDLPMWTALAIALIFVVQPGRTGAVILSVLIVLTITLLAAKGRRIGWIGILVILGAGIALRLGVFDHRASDVLDVTGDALRRAFLGSSPWGQRFHVLETHGRAVSLRSDRALLVHARDRRPP